MNQLLLFWWVLLILWLWDLMRVIYSLVITYLLFFLAAGAGFVKFLKFLPNINVRKKTYKNASIPRIYFLRQLINCLHLISKWHILWKEVHHKRKALEEKSILLNKDHKRMVQPRNRSNTDHVQFPVLL